MKVNIYLLILLIIGFLTNCKKCEEVNPKPCGNNLPNSEWCGWTVATCYGIRNNSDVGVIYNTSANHLLEAGIDLGLTINTIHPKGWKVNNIGQIFGITTDKNDNIYLASSDIYYFDNNWPNKDLKSGNINRPYPCGQIFKCSPPSWNPIPFVNLINDCSPLNGIGNIAYDKWNDQLFASNLEDGKIYRIAMNGDTLESFDPWQPDDNSMGIVVETERIWGLGIGSQKGIIKVYFAQIIEDQRILYSIDLKDSEFVQNKKENVEIESLYGSGPLISDISLSSDSKKILLAERGGPHAAQSFSYTYVNSQWQFNTQYFTGQTHGNHCAGGIDFGYSTNAKNSKRNCDNVLWVSSNIMTARISGEKLYGITQIDFNGNNRSDSGSPNANQDTDLFIDFDGQYNFDPKETIGDVEVFDCNDCFDPCSLNDFTN